MKSRKILTITIHSYIENKNYEVSYTNNDIISLGKNYKEYCNMKNISMNYDNFNNFIINYVYDCCVFALDICDKMKLYNKVLDYEK